MTEPKKKETVHCPECDGQDIVFDAPVRWNYEKQDWVIASGPYDSAYCNECEEETKRPIWK